MGLLGLGAQVGILLPYNRSQESEADVLGLEYMAKAGFDPQESIKLWQNMAQAGGNQPPEFLSTHPAHETRIEQLDHHMAKAQALYQQARAQGRSPNCS
jgi:predicted Zn-dependent protease